MSDQLNANMKVTALYQHLREIALITLKDDELTDCLQGLYETHNEALAHNLAEEEFNYLSQRLKQEIFNYFIG